MDALHNIVADAGGSKASKGLLASLLGPNATEGDLKALSQQAGSLWKFLDELAESDPNEYARFIEKQATALKEEVQAKQDPRLSSSEPQLVIDTRKAGAVPAQPCSVRVWPIKEGYGFAAASWGQPDAAVCTSSQPQAMGLRIPLAEFQPSEPERSLPPATQGVAVQTWHIACLAMTLQDALKPNSQDRLALLVEAACQFVEHKHGVTLDRQARTVRVSRALLSPEQLSHLDQARQQAAVAHAVSGTAAADLPSGWLEQLVGNKDSKGPPAADAKLALGKKAPLIQELSSKAEASAHALQVSCMYRDGVEYVTVEATLPGVSKAKELDIEVVDGKELMIRLPAGEELSAAIPKPIVEDSVTAKLDKPTKVLTVSMQVAT